MTKTNRIILELIRKALNKEYQVDKAVFSNAPWADVIEKATEQGVLAVCFDAFESMPVTCRPDIDNLMEWLGQVEYQATVYEEHRKAIAKLTDFYASHGIKMLLLKGVGLSFNYPIPKHRPCGDIDIYLYGDGAKGDALMQTELGIESKQNEEKHSVFEICPSCAPVGAQAQSGATGSGTNITVENHACIINNNRYPSLSALERYFEEDAENAVPVDMIAKEMEGFYLPSVATNALFLPYHIADHFVRGEASLRQLCDWACFVKRYHNNISWSSTEAWAKKAGFYRFFCCLNGIVQDYLGVDASYFPKWERDKMMEERVMAEILSKQEPKVLSLMQKVIRYFSSAWKFRLVYNENILLASIRQARAYALIKWNKGGKSIWE